MSLDFNYGTLPEDAKPNGPDWAITESLIWATMGIGINTITEANAEEFHTRLMVWHRAIGVRQGNPSERITLADVRKRIGLSTNATPLTKAGFKNNVWRILMADAEGDTRRDRVNAQREAASLAAARKLADATPLKLVTIDQPVTAPWNSSEYPRVSA